MESFKSDLVNNRNIIKVEFDNWYLILHLDDGSYLKINASFDGELSVELNGHPNIPSKNNYMERTLPYKNLVIEENL